MGPTPGGAVALGVGVCTRTIIPAVADVIIRDDNSAMTAAFPPDDHRARRHGDRPGGFPGRWPSLANLLRLDVHSADLLLAH